MLIIEETYDSKSLKELEVILTELIGVLDLNKKVANININKYQPYFKDLYRTGHLSFENIITSLRLGLLSQMKDITKNKKTIIIFLTENTENKKLNNHEVIPTKNNTIILDPNEMSEIDIDSFCFVLNIDSTIMPKDTKSII